MQQLYNTIKTYEYSTPVRTRLKNSIEDPEFVERYKPE